MIEQQNLATIGVVALIPGQLPFERVVEIADALLAAPILAVQVVPNGDSTGDTLRALRKRAGDHMLVGADRVESVAELNGAIEHGAQFASSAAEFHLPLIAAAKQQDFLYIPTVHAPGQTLMAYRAGSIWQKIRDDIDVEGLEGLLERSQMVGYRPQYIVNQIEIDNIPFAVEGGAKMVCVNDIYLDENQPMSDIILRARAARDEWLAAIDILETDDVTSADG